MAPASSTKSYRVSSDVDHQLKDAARHYGCFYGGEPSVPQLLESIGKSWHLVSQKTLQQLLKKAELAQIPIDQPIEAVLLEIANHDFVTCPTLPSAAVLIQEILAKQQSFVLSYDSPSGAVSNYECSYGHLICRSPWEIGEPTGRWYLETYCVEPNGSETIPELAHNRVFRLDRLGKILLSPSSSPWRSEGLATVDVELHLFDRLALNYTSPLNEVSSSPLEGGGLRVIWRVDSFFWLWRKILPYGNLCKVVAPEEVELRFVNELKSTFAQYL